MYQKKLNSVHYGTGLLLQIIKILQEEKKPLKIAEIQSKLQNIREPQRNVTERIRKATNDLLAAEQIVVTQEETRFKAKVNLYQWKQ
jgi:predicted Zn-ribbon and HTH transcriptional regulator